ncbi:MAG: DUF4403 family protein [Candidatus Micrarchaeaceae archaeon]|jgi:hypothetical protein
MKLRLLVLSSVTTLAALLTSGCHNIEVNPQDPSGAPGPALISAHPSYLAVPVTVNISDVAAFINTKAPSHVEGTYHITWNKPIPQVHWHGFHTSVTVTHQSIELAHIDWHANRGDVKLTASGNAIGVHVPFSGGGKLIPSAATADANGSVDGSSTLTMTPDYGFSPTIGLNVNIDHAAVLHDISVKGLVQGAINEAVNNFKGSIGPAVAAKVDLRGHAQNVWSNLPSSILVPGTKDLWISLDPQGIALDGPRASNDVVTAVLGVKVQMRTLFQPTAPEAPVRAALPNISGPPADQKFHIGLPIEILPGELNNQLSELIQDKKIQKVDLSKELGASESAVIKSITVFPYGNRFYLKVVFIGVDGKLLKHVRGTLIFVAHPILSADKQTLSFDQIDYTDETSATLKGLGLEALVTIGRPIIVGLLQKKLSGIQFAKPLETAKTKANAAVNTAVAELKLPKPLNLQFNLENLAAQDLAVYGNKIYLGFDASGTASVTY